MADLFTFLDKLSRRDLNAYSDLSEDDQKEFHPFVIARWLTGTTDRAQIIRINETVNLYTFKLDKEILFKLCAAACTGKSSRYSWIKAPVQSSTKLSIDVIMQKYNASLREAKGYLPLLESSDLLEFAAELGWSKEEQKKLTLELDKDGTRSGSTAKVSRKKKD